MVDFEMAVMLYDFCLGIREKTVLSGLQTL